MAALLYVAQNLVLKQPNGLKIRSFSKSKAIRCLRCNTLYSDLHNSPSVCSFHGHTTGRREGSVFITQGIDGEWSDASGVIVYKWNDKHNIDQTCISFLC